MPHNLWDLREAPVRSGIKSGVKAGFLKCAINTLDESGQIAACERKAVRACARAGAEPGRSIHIHNAFPLTAEHILPIAEMVLDLDSDNTIPQRETYLSLRFRRRNDSGKNPEGAACFQWEDMLYL